MGAICGHKIVTTAGTAETLGDGSVNGALAVKALNANTGLIYIGNDGAGDVSAENGLELAAGEVIVFGFVGNLSSIKIDASVSGEGAAWLALEA